MDSPFDLCGEGHLECSPAAGADARGSLSICLRASSSGLPCPSALRFELESSALPECCGSMATDSMSSLVDDDSVHSRLSTLVKAGFPSPGLEDTLLCCDELDDGGLSAAHSPSETQPWAPLQARPPPFARGTDIGDAVEAASNGVSRDLLLRPTACRRVKGSVRTTAVSWIVEVATGMALQSETLFQAVALFDRFLSATLDVPPESMLQLLALACISLAAKGEEVPQYHADHWLLLAVDASQKPLFRREDLQKMEWLVLETLDWKLRSPTAHSLLQHFTHILVGTNSGVVPAEAARQTFVSCAHFLTELSLLHEGFLCYSNSVIAVACLVLSEWTVKGGAAADLHAAPALQSVLPLDMRDLRPCVEALHQLYTQATATTAEAAAAAGRPLVDPRAVRPVVSRYTSTA